MRAKTATLQPAHALTEQAGQGTMLTNRVPQAWLERYWQLGFDTVPVDARSKSISIRGWNDPMARFREPRMYRNRNIGIRLGAVSGGLVDVDLDTPAACAVAPYILPSTHMRMRKHGKPIAHYFYRCPEPPTTHQWELRGETVLELRSQSADGKPAQTVVPPSVDGDGLMREWVDDALEPADVDAETLQRACTLTAIAAAVLPHYRTGSRHQLALALAGWLRKCGIAEADARGVVDALARATNDTELTDRLRAVADTYAKPLDTIAGMRRLRELLGADTCDTLARWLSVPPEPPTAAVIMETSESEPYSTLKGSQRVYENLKRLWAGRYLYIVERKQWVQWTDTGWQTLPPDTPYTLAAETLKHYYTDGLRRTPAGSDLYRLLTQSLSELGNLRTIQDGVRLLAGDPAFQSHKDDWDAEPNILCAPNGVIDLDTGELRPHTPEVRCFRRTRAEYQPDADAPLWQRFLNDIFGTPELIDYIQKAFGAALYGRNREQALLILWGHGANGKSTLVNTIMHVLGDYAGVIPRDALLQRKQAQDAKRIIYPALEGLRLGVLDELEDGALLSATALKDLTSNNPIGAREHYKAYDRITIQLTPVISTNIKPTITEHTHAVWRRLRLIPFLRTIPPEQQDRDLPDKLKAEATGILAWLVNGYLRYRADGLQLPALVQRETEQYRREEDALLDWLNERIERDPNAKCGFSELYADYRAYCEDGCAVPVGKKTFGRTLTQHGFGETRDARKRYRLGLRLRPSERSG